MQTKKIALACGVGGILCSGIALLCAPVFWWLGLLAGFAGGYVSYEFREVALASPLAFERACSQGKRVSKNSVRVIGRWLIKPHPFLYLAFATVPLLLMAFFYFSSIATKDAFVWLVIIAPYIFSVTIITTVFLLWTAVLGAQAEHSYWVDPWLRQEMHPREMRKQGYRKLPLTYCNAFRWIALGLVVRTKLAMQSGRQCVVFGASFVNLSGRFLWHLFKLIHSKERLLCAVDGTLGGALAYIWLAPTATTFSAQLVVVLFGGFLGAALGVANWEIVSKRILHVTPRVS